jgi:hypothetical protein
VNNRNNQLKPGGNTVKVLKSEFAKALGISGVKVTAWIKSGKLDGPALSGSLIESDAAIKQLRERLEIADNVGVLLRIEALLQAALRANAHEFDSKVRRGVLIERKKAVEMLRTQASKSIKEAEETLQRLARKLAKEFQLPEQEVAQGLRETFDKKVRPAMDAAAAKALKRLDEKGR